MPSRTATFSSNSLGTVHLGTVHLGHRTGRLEHPRTRRLGPQRCAARPRSGAQALALGLRRHLFSFAPAGADSGWAAHDSEPGLRHDREGVDGLKAQLWAEAMRHGLGRANQVLIVADGAVWIWNLAGDRFPGARQRVDFYHVSQHLWAVAHTLHPDDAAAARAWVEPLLAKSGRASCEVITELEQLQGRLEGAQARRCRRKSVTSKATGTGWTMGRPDRKASRWAAGLKSTCRQTMPIQAHRTILEPDRRRSLMCLETFRRNGRWHLLFPHLPTPPKTDLRPGIYFSIFCPSRFPSNL